MLFCTECWEDTVLSSDLQICSQLWLNIMCELLDNQSQDLMSLSDLCPYLKTRMFHDSNNNSNTINNNYYCCYYCCCCCYSPWNGDSTTQFMQIGPMRSHRKTIQNQGGFLNSSLHKHVNNVNMSTSCRQKMWRLALGLLNFITLPDSECFSAYLHILKVYFWPSYNYLFGSSKKIKM